MAVQTQPGSAHSSGRQQAPQRRSACLASARAPGNSPFTGLQMLWSDCLYEGGGGPFTVSHFLLFFFSSLFFAFFFFFSPPPPDFLVLFRSTRESFIIFLRAQGELSPPPHPEISAHQNRPKRLAAGKTELPGSFKQPGHKGPLSQPGSVGASPERVKAKTQC